MLASIREGLTSGPEGWVEDDLALVASGGTELANVRAPAALWYGEQGALVPTAHARWLADAIPGAELRLFVGEGNTNTAQPARGLNLPAVAREPETGAAHDH